MKLNKNGKMTVYMIGDQNQYEIEKPPEISSQGWKELVGLFSENEKIYHDAAIMVINHVCSNIVDGKDTGKDLIQCLQFSIFDKLLQIRLLQDLIKNSEFYKSGEITDLIMDDYYNDKHLMKFDKK